jgi:hypothetical protein
MGRLPPGSRSYLLSQANLKERLQLPDDFVRALFHYEVPAALKHRTVHFRGHTLHRVGEGFADAVLSADGEYRHRELLLRTVLVLLEHLLAEGIPVVGKGCANAARLREDAQGAEGAVGAVTRGNARGAQGPSWAYLL